MAHEQKSFCELFLKSKVPMLLKRPPTFFLQKKLIVLTPKLVQGLRTMSLAKAVPEGITDRVCKRFTLRERSPVPYVPEKEPLKDKIWIWQNEF